MDEPTPAPSDAAALRRLAVQRRAKRGLVASYIHGLSERHGRDAVTRNGVVPRPPQTAD